MLITITIIVMLTGLGIINFTKINSADTVLQQTSDLILNNLHKTYAQSLLTNDLKVCAINPGSGNNRADCATNQTIWNNINGNKIDPKVQVQVSSETTNKSIAIIKYTNGVITKVIYTNANDAEEDPEGQKIWFTLTPRNINPSACKKITLWLNGITEKQNTCQ